MTIQPRNFAREDGVLRFETVGDLTLESGEVLPEVTLAYETWGELNHDASNAILVLHALTGDTHVSRGLVGGDADAKTRAYAETEGWWAGIVGAGAVIDTNKYFVVSPNILGGCNGSTGPASAAPSSIDPENKPWGSRFPQVTIRDTVRAEARLADALGIPSFSYVIGASLGGARSVEWAATFPDRVRGCAVIASASSATADTIAWGHMQNLAIRQDPHFAGGDYYDGAAPETGLALARRIAHTTYRSAAELDFRFGRDVQPGEQPLTSYNTGRGRYQVESYLDYQGEKLVKRFDANSYLAINEALLTHDVARGRGSLRQALEPTAHCHWLVAYVDSDRLFFPSDSHILASALPHPVEPQVIHSPSGHDGFLIETGQVERILRQALAEHSEREEENREVPSQVAAAA
ncbi:homoserine O-acetyltransferase [Rothia sp. ZJ932]|uniref:homoserine O-acetyltransferase MetX n=1 Tax=Rothia sp. ZJ932 TaxID=2810516 RepID=UPI001967FC1B|nr:homoserine O-acetyltransferase [Rothia sp. ZJ932]QRZ61146.1 homoserine O-acetyltransferase [Rothia sp. ZJ932]